ncbi:cysteine hydrolase family protein [Actinomadura parmotrematis]|uniref:Cysteine hydrolase n=1 Tax=Actinomadura parmotrematis TaxID=2864039 RepID=A0ABS7FTY9_9ACTN|nr:isochorismatase family cysteine hydrolase [Actinomadura parmotrematis]MBW8483435.1 cysteine hydrolase [Actinomadura parmotrematis]
MPSTALIVIDMLNPYDHDDSEPLQESVERMVEPLAGLLRRADGLGPDGALVVYVNDNHGDFSATRQDLVAAARKGRRPDLVEPVVPGPERAFLAKVRHSAFYGTPLEYLLGSAEVDRVVLAGQVTEQCVLYTALDAYIRHFTVQVPRDAVAAIDDRLGEAALEMMERNMHAEIVTAATCLR